MNSHAEAYSLPLFDSPQHCGVDVSALTRPDDAAAPSREEIIQRVYDEADADFLDRYRRHLIAFADGLVDFTACDVTVSYESLYGKLTVIEGKQLGGLYRRLQLNGVLEKTGEYRERNQGNVAAVYRLKK